MPRSSREKVGSVKALRVEWLARLRGSGGTLDERHVATALDLLVPSIRAVVEAEGSLRIPGLGTFRKTKRKARRISSFLRQAEENEAFNRALRTIPETRSVRFSPAEEWRRSLR